MDVLRKNVAAALSLVGRFGAGVLCVLMMTVGLAACSMFEDPVNEADETAESSATAETAEMSADPHVLLMRQDYDMIVLGGFAYVRVDDGRDAEFDSADQLSQITTVNRMVKRDTAPLLQGDATKLGVGTPIYAKAEDADKMPDQYPAYVYVKDDDGDDGDDDVDDNDDDADAQNDDDNDDYVPYMKMVEG